MGDREFDISTLESETGISQDLRHHSGESDCNQSLSHEITTSPATLTASVGNNHTAEQTVPQPGQLQSNSRQLVEILLTHNGSDSSVCQGANLLSSQKPSNPDIVVVVHRLSCDLESRDVNCGKKEVDLVPFVEQGNFQSSEIRNPIEAAVRTEMSGTGMVSLKKTRPRRRKAVQTEKTSYVDCIESERFSDDGTDSNENAADIDNDNGSDNSDSDDGEDPHVRKCVVCLRNRKFTEDVYDAQKQVFYHVDILLAHLNIQIKKSSKNGKSARGYLNAGICPECMDHLQRWHIFHCAIGKRHEAAAVASNEKLFNEPIPYESFEARVYRNYKKMSKVKEVFLSATHAHYARRHLTEKDWDFFCDHLFHSNSVKSEKSRELERFLTSRDKLSQLFCLKCNKLISNGKRGYAKHMLNEHNESPVMYPCDICGCMFPEKDMTASTEDYYPHWISHFYFNKCDDCGKRFPTKRALGQHRHAVHKNRQVKCDKCGKVLANKMSLDLHLLRHLPENEKKKYMIKCKVCKKKIAQWNLKSHMATHNDERPWKCDHCDATFKMKGALVSHRDVVHFNLKNHVCSICNEAFKSASSLRGHVRRHEGRKDYKCDVCLKEYYTYSALKGHKVVHQTTRDFICEICGKAFKKKKALEEHGTIHTGEKPHQCPICGREVRVKSNLYKHMKIHKKNQNDGMRYSPKHRSSTNQVDENTTVDNYPNDSNFTTPSACDPSNLLSLVPGSDSMSSGSNLEISEPSILSNSRQSQSGDDVHGQTSFLPGHFSAAGSVDEQNSSLDQSMELPEQHVDLINPTVPAGQFYNVPQYFGAIDPLRS